MRPRLDDLSSSSNFSRGESSTGALKSAGDTAIRDTNNTDHESQKLGSAVRYMPSGESPRAGVELLPELWAAVR